MEKIAVIFAGGQGTRLKPMTNYINKHLLNVYNKPLINHPLSIVKSCKIKNVFIICNPNDIKIFKKYLSAFNSIFKFEFVIQKKPNGIVGGLKLLKNKISLNTKMLLLLGDNIFVGQGLYQNFLKPALDSKKSLSIFSVYSNKPEKFGVIMYDKNNIPKKIIEKPTKFISNDIVTGMYVIDSNCLRLLNKIKLSRFNQYEITDLINIYFGNEDLEIFKFGAGFTWMDCGEPESLFRASEVVKLYYDLFKIDIGSIG